MAVLVKPPLPSLLFIPNHHRETTVRCSSFSEVKMPTLKGTASSSGRKSTGPAILWYKNDLRVDDHPGLIAASRHSVVVPLYVLDHRIIGHFTEEMLELLLFAVEDLRKSLKGLGSDLMVRFGRTESVIQDLVKEVRASSIYTEEEVEYDLQLLMENVEANLATILLEEKSPKLLLWGTDFYDMKNMKDLPASYEDFERLKLAVQPPVLPIKLPALEMDLAWGCIPKLGDLKELINNNPCKSKDSLISTKNTSAEYVLQKARISKSKSVADGFVLESAESNQSKLNAQGKSKRFKKSFFTIQEVKFVAGGTSDVLNALAAYLRYLEGTSRDDWQEIHEKLRYAETREGASFGALFGPALQLGIISRRRVYHETIKYEKERNGGFLSPFGYSTTTVSAAVGHVRSMEWYWLIALRSQMDYTERYPTRYWRWNGHLIQYTAVGHAGPAILLVHGFGAFLDHYRDNIHDIVQGGNRVWAITLLGFGRSEKPNVVYTELMWAELLRNFIVDVVGEPVHLVGNSFGGYFVSIVASLWPALAGSVVLLNSAGHYIPGYSSVPPSKERQTSGIAWLGARLLSFYLRLSFRNLVKRCYPTKTNRADEGLLNEMMRASYDPGVVVVLESIFTFDPSIPLNYLLKGFEEKVLIIQGMKDPISDSKKKVAVVRQHFKGILIKELDAGHCPHDELPEEVNSIIREWVVDVGSTSVKGFKEKSELPA